MPKFTKGVTTTDEPGLPSPTPPAPQFQEVAAWPFPKGFEVRAFAMEHRQPGRKLRLATFVMVDGRVVRVEYGPDNIEPVVGGQGFAALEDQRIRINELQFPGFPQKR